MLFTSDSLSLRTDAAALRYLDYSKCYFEMQGNYHHIVVKIYMKDFICNADVRVGRK